MRFVGDVKASSSQSLPCREGSCRDRGRCATSWTRHGKGAESGLSRPSPPGGAAPFLQVRYCRTAAAAGASPCSGRTPARSAIVPQRCGRRRAFGRHRLP
eukprot:scaffold91_cov254-Pinguiococcus_pyrenoidosus.AAC.6